MFIDFAIVEACLGFSAGIVIGLVIELVIRLFVSRTPVRREHEDY